MALVLGLIEADLGEWEWCKRAKEKRDSGFFGLGVSLFSFDDLILNLEKCDHFNQINHQLASNNWKRSFRSHWTKISLLNEEKELNNGGMSETVGTEPKRQINHSKDLFNSRVSSPFLFVFKLRARVSYFRLGKQLSII